MLIAACDWDESVEELRVILPIMTQKLQHNVKKSVFVVDVEIDKALCGPDIH